MIHLSETITRDLNNQNIEEGQLDFFVLLERFLTKWSKNLIQFNFLVEYLFLFLCN